MPSDGKSPSLPPSTSPAPRPTRRPGRPWYLVLALLGAWFFGSQAALVGWQYLSLFKTGTEQVETRETDDSAPDERAQAEQDRVDDAVYAAHRRMIPLAAASLLVGVTLWIFAVGAMAGREGARVLLCQLVAAHAVIGVLFYLLTPDVRRVQVEVLREANDLALETSADGGAPDAHAQQQRALMHEVIPFVHTAQLGLDLLLHFVVLVALTRRRTRAFYGLSRG